MIANLQSYWFIPLESQNQSKGHIFIAGGLWVTAFRRVRPEKAKTCKVTQLFVIKKKKKGASVKYIWIEVIQCLCVVPGEAQIYIQTTKGVKL